MIQLELLDGRSDLFVVAQSSGKLGGQSNTLDLADLWLVDSLRPIEGVIQTVSIIRKWRVDAPGKLAAYSRSDQIKEA